jgi:hypothetical protein
MTVLAEVPAAATNPKVSQFASSHFLHDKFITSEQKYPVKYPVSFDTLVPTSSKTCTHATIK